MSETSHLPASANERLIEAIARAELRIEQSTSSDDGLLSEIVGLRAAFENLGHDWEKLPLGLQADFGDLEDNFSQASDAYLQVCDQLTQALVGRDRTLLEQAKEGLARAQSLLKAADNAAQEHFARWSATS